MASIKYLLLTLTCLFGLPNKQVSVSKRPAVSELLPVSSKIIVNNKGLVVLSDAYNYSTLRIYNADNTTWKSFKFNDDFNDKQIQPFAQKADHGVLVFRCVGETATHYAVIVSEPKHVVKYIRKVDKVFIQQSWQTHILHVFSVEFDQAENPLRVSANVTAPIVKYEKDAFYFPVKIAGDWLLVKSENSNSKAWVRWMDEKGQLLIDLYYEA
nr:hypothetical protein [Mucilaginibacter sp. L294]